MNWTRKNGLIGFGRSRFVGRFLAVATDEEEEQRSEEDGAYY